jgi:hypothetical protein
MECITHVGDEHVQNSSQKTSRERPLGLPRHRWESNIKVGLKNTVYKDVDWIRMAQDRDQWQNLVNTGMNFMVQ